MEQNKTYKRQDRGVSPQTRQKISSTLKSYNATHTRSESHCKKISDGLQHYWGQIPPKPDNPIETGEIV